MNADWTSAAKAGQACLHNTDVTASSSVDLYETDADFAAKCSTGFDEDGAEYVDNDGNDWTFSGILGKLSTTNTDNITYKFENGKLIKNTDRTIDYTCESVTVIYTKANLAGDANGDNVVNVADIVRLVKDKAPKADIDAVVKIIMGQ